jgi:hypothetical protein
MTLFRSLIHNVHLPILFFFIFYFFIYDNESLQDMSHFVYPSLLGKPRTRAKRPFHTDWVILRLRRWIGSKELFVPKGIRTLDLIEMLPRPRPLPLKSKCNLMLIKHFTKCHTVHFSTLKPNEFLLLTSSQQKIAFQTLASCHMSKRNLQMSGKKS